MITGTIMVLGLPIVIVFARRMWTRDSSAAAPSSPETDHRLERIENAIDAMAVEIERVSEGQRFVTKLLADRQPERAGIAPSHQRHEA